MDIRPIRTKADYRRTLKEIEALMDAAPNTPKGDQLDVLVALVEAYERKHYPLRPALTAGRRDRRIAPRP